MVWPYTLAMAADSTSQSAAESWTMQRESIHTYGMPRKRATPMVWRNVVGRRALSPTAHLKVWLAMHMRSLALIKRWLAAELVLAPMRGCCAAGELAER